VGKDFEFLALNQILVFAALPHKFLEQASTLFNEGIFFVAYGRLFRNGRHIAAWPSFNQRCMQRIELFIPPLHLKLALIVRTSYFVFNNLSNFYDSRSFTHFYWICYKKQMLASFLIFEALGHCNCICAVVDIENLI